MPPRATVSKTWDVLGAVPAVSFDTVVSLRLRFLYLLAEGFPEGKGRRKMQRLAGTQYWLRVAQLGGEPALLGWRQGLTPALQGELYL